MRLVAESLDETIVAGVHTRVASQTQDYLDEGVPLAYRFQEAVDANMQRKTWAELVYTNDVQFDAFNNAEIPGLNSAPLSDASALIDRPVADDELLVENQEKVLVGRMEIADLASVDYAFSLPNTQDDLGVYSLNSEIGSLRLNGAVGVYEFVFAHDAEVVNALAEGSVTSFVVGDVIARSESGSEYRDTLVINVQGAPLTHR
jgi:hypothetical protein